NGLRRLRHENTSMRRREIGCLHEVLNPNEVIRGITSGFYENRTWVIVVTNSRLVFLDKGMIYGLRQLDMSLHQISSVAHRTRLFFGEVEVATGSGTKTIGCIAKGDVVKISNILSAEIHAVRNPKPAGSSAPATTSGGTNQSLAGELERLAELYSSGALDEQEFRASKARLLGMEPRT
ncbi:MAG TPA: PH domain-containing protein, partial [Oligoflexia bacterium]|nr:PH domain-containing protein [Oligoflexia bacterium]